MELEVIGFRVGAPLSGGVAQLTSLRLAGGLLAPAGRLVVALAPNAAARRPHRGAVPQPSLTT